MRDDMHKVIVERPRLGHALPSDKTGRRLSANQIAEAFAAPEDYDSGPRRAPSSRRDKQLNEYLRPLERFLQRQVGRPWSKVYSEISARIDRRSAIGLHVMQHVTDFIAVNAIRENGVVYEIRHGSRWPVRGLYVDPVTRLVRQVRRATRRR
jgi:hypothetical protein